MHFAGILGHRIIIINNTIIIWSDAHWSQHRREKQQNEQGKENTTAKFAGMQPVRYPIEHFPT